MSLETVIAASHRATRLENELKKVIRGKDEVVRLALVSVLSRGHLLIEGVPGVGKTTLAHAMARALGCSFQRVQFTSDMLPSDIIGISIYSATEEQFEFKRGPIFTNVLLADEINRTTPKTQSALLEAMNEGQITVDARCFPLPQPFLVIATQNPVEHHGTYPLPESQLDRFLMRVRMGYPDASDEDAILLRFESENPLDTLQPVVEAPELVHLGAMLPSVYCEVTVRDYIVRLGRTTRDHAAVELGASPRGTLALGRASQALAALRGRDYVLPDDVKALAGPVFIHRLVLTTDARIRDRRAEELLGEVLEALVDGGGDLVAALAQVGDRVVEQGQLAGHLPDHRAGDLENGRGR